jgi:methylated-DNA-[protein]-cysteine S-methyltransferase
MIRHRIFATCWGCCAVVAGDRGILATFLPQRSRPRIEALLRRQFPHSRHDPKLLPGLVRSFRAYFQGKPARFDARLDLTGVTEFRRRALEACRKIPRGRTAAYADLARAAGSPRAGRAVGSAMANNPLPLIVPCHRVVRSDGTLGGFSSPEGIRLKRRLLELERVPGIV